MQSIVRGKSVKREVFLHPAQNERKTVAPCPNAPISTDEARSIVRRMEMFRRGELTFRQVQLGTWHPARGRHLGSDEILNIFLQHIEDQQQAEMERVRMDAFRKVQNAEQKLRRAFAGFRGAA